MMPSLCKQRVDEHGTRWSLGRYGSEPDAGRHAAWLWRKRGGRRGGEGGGGAHGEAAVVDLGHEARLLLLGRHVGVPLEGVIQVEADPVGKLLRDSVEGRHVAGLASLHVMRGAVEPDLRPPLKEANAKDDLPLRSVGQSVPLLRRARRRDRVEGRPRET
jgi:hypothetical protein